METTIRKLVKFSPDEVEQIEQLAAANFLKPSGVGNFSQTVRTVMNLACLQPHRLGLAAPGQSLADLPTINQERKRLTDPDGLDVSYALLFICEGEEKSPVEIRQVLEELAGKVRQTAMQDAANMLLAGSATHV